ncbi:MAG: FtsW/RodA/SpoVE family cell cycle protein [Clostridia bacterium]|nr:FtsW/RodA/SpoVE family cell cycle protein [Clostridia bacterium]
MRSISKSFKPIYGILLVNLIGFVLLYFYKKPFEKITIYIGLTTMVLTSAIYLFILIKKLGDEYLFLIVSMLASIGIIMIYRLDRELGIKQVIWFTGGTVLFLISYFVFSRWNLWSRLIYLYAGTSLVLFLLTLIFGSDIKGANNWIVVAGFNFQPSEIIKVLYVMFIASYFTTPEKLNIPEITLLERKISVHNRGVFIACVYMFIGFLILQREWGSALLFFIVFYLFLYIYGTGLKTLLFNGAMAFMGGSLGYLFLYHIKVRIDIWLDPWKDVSNKGYQIAQSLFAIGAGGFFGTGLGLGRPDFIPEVHTDFIFSAICEEMGIFGGIAVILLYFLLIYRGFKIALSIREPFGKSVALGLTLMFGFQTFIILGGVTKLTPLTGITLPFISYGGSSLVSSFISLGILQAVSKKAL